MNHLFISLLPAIALLVCRPASADQPQPAAPVNDEVLTTKLVLHPAAEPTPALKYQLLPTLLDRKPGNAALIYNKVGQTLGAGTPLETLEKLNKLHNWLEMPVADLPRDEVRKLISGYTNEFKQLDRAARYRECDWELPLGEGFYFAIRLPDLQVMRTSGRLLAVKAKLEIAEGNLDEALHTLQTGFAVARHTGEEPTLLSYLYGTLISKLMSDRLLELFQQPDTPNLYWSVTVLGHSYIDMRPALESDMYALYLSFPWLKEVDGSAHSPKFWRQRFHELAETLGGWSRDPQRWQSRLKLTAATIRRYPTAKQLLIDEGRSSAEVEAMSVAQVVTIYTMRSYEELQDEVFKWLHLPYWQGREGLEKVKRQISATRADREILPMVEVFLENVSGVNHVRARQERSIALLRVVEAVRLYGVTHDSRLPQALSDITEVPLPIDPVTGKPFAYRLMDGVGVLESPPPSGLAARYYGVRYEISFTH